MEIEHNEITFEKLGKAGYNAKTVVTKPFKADLAMFGKTEEIAKQKLILFMKGEPYKHLDK